MREEEIPKKILEQAYRNYADSHTIFPEKQTGNFLHDLPKVIPMKYGKSKFFQICHEDTEFLEKYLNQNKDD